jgi:hypothetical protein
MAELPIPTPAQARKVWDSMANPPPKGKPADRGWLTENGEYLGRPVDVAQLPDGSIIVSDDLAGAVYRIWYEGRIIRSPTWPRSCPGTGTAPSLSTAPPDMAAPASAVTIGRAAEILGEDEELLWDLTLNYRARRE